VATRKTVTVLFMDIVDSTGLGERFDPEALRRVIGGYFDEARQAVERHGGTLEKFIGTRSWRRSAFRSPARTTRYARSERRPSCVSGSRI
jgi:class 3 adenylate cyclase